MKAKSDHDANFVFIGSTAGCHYDKHAVLLLMTKLASRPLSARNILWVEIIIYVPRLQ